MMRKLFFLSILSFLVFSAQAQNIGIGTANPDYLLDVNGSMGVNDYIYHNGDNDASWMGFPGSNQWEIVLNNNQVASANGDSREFIVNGNSQGVDFIVVADGIEHLLVAETDQFRVGIGTTTPDYLLDVNGTMSISDFIIHNGDSDSWMGFPSNDKWELTLNQNRVIDANGVSRQLIINPDDDNLEFIIVADGIEHLFHANTSASLIGIGTSSPQYLLDVNGDFRVISDQIEHLIFASSVTGRVGIGTDNPTTLLDVAGHAKVEELTIGAATGTSFQSMQSGSVNVTANSNSGEAVPISITFPNGGFSSTPKIIASPVNLSGPNNLSFAVTVISITPTGAILNIDLVTHENGWTDDIQINWMAWE